MTLPRASTDAAARVPLCESIPIATSTLASFRRPTYDGGWRRTSRRRGRPSLLSSHFLRPGSGRRDDQVKGQRLSRGPRLAVQSHLRPVPDTLAQRRNHRGISYACGFYWSGRRDSNPRPPPWQRSLCSSTTVRLGSSWQVEGRLRLSRTLPDRSERPRTEEIGARYGASSGARERRIHEERPVGRRVQLAR